jgi:hypothetical protein
LLVVADGPRPGHAGDPAACRAVRDIVTSVDWSCELLTRFNDTNLGCRRGVASGLDWAFAQVEAAIVLEDDCLPDPSFFEFCAELLQLYADDPRVMMVGGHRWEGPDLPETDSYYFSRYPAIWGWATWADRWRHFDLDMAACQELRAGPWLSGLLPDPIAESFWRREFDAMTAGLDTWDWAWFFACWVADGLSVRPNVGLVQNIGFGPGATHTSGSEHAVRSRTAGRMRFPLAHPAEVAADRSNESLIEWVNFSGQLRRQLREAARRIVERRPGSLPQPPATSTAIETTGAAIAATGSATHATTAATTR